MSPHSKKHWSEISESGTYWGMYITLMFYRVFGWYAMNIILLPIIAYFYLFKPAARHASMTYLSQIHRHMGLTPPGAWDNFRHFLSFGNNLVDRVAAWSGDIKREDIQFENRATLIRHSNEHAGGLLFTAHLGNLEMTRALIGGVSTVKMNILVFTHHAPQINRLMQKINADAQVNLIQISTVGPDTIELLDKLISKGEFVVIAADRTSPNSPGRVTSANFLGRPACFPQGPFILASLLQCPVYLMVCIKRQGRYKIQLETFADPIELPRKQRTQALQHYVQRFSNRLEYFCTLAPDQWFNFFDFWLSSEDKHNAITASRH